MIRAKLNEQELALYEVMRHPVWCSEFLRNVDLDNETDKPWILTEYQQEMLCDHNKYVSLCCGRAVGKSEAILDKTSWYMINNFFPHDPVSIITPNRVHLEPLFSKLRRWLQTHSFLGAYVQRQGINSSIFNITARNGFQLDCRIAGTSGGGANVMGLHTPVIMLDEAGIFPWGTWIELLPTHNTWTEGAQLFVSGVPTGQREKNVLYFADQIDPNFTRFNVSQHRNPRYTDADEVRNRKQFGGTESEDYIHLVLGRHGTPIFSLFDREKMLITSYDVFVSKVYGAKLQENPNLLNDLLTMLPAAPAGAQVAFGIDLGYTEPTVITILIKRKNELFWKFLSRIIFYQVVYPSQEDFIAKLDRMYNPVFIGIDAGGPGKVVIQHLVNDRKYDRQHLFEKIVSTDFNAALEVGFDQDGNPLKEKAKVFAMQKLQQLTNNHGIMYSSADDDVIIELERTMYTRSPAGNIIYKTLTELGGQRGDDHNVASLLAFMLGWHHKYGDTAYKRRRVGNLWKPRFM
jgi:hypothetical protein